MKSKFDYESKPFGIGEVSTAINSIPALKLKYCFDNLAELEKKQGKEVLRILEVGCGGGAMTRAIKTNFPKFEVVGCDISQKALNLAKGEGVKLIYADAYDLPFKNNSFDAVVTFDFLEHVSDLKKVLFEIQRVLVPGGLFYSAIPYEGSLWTIHGWLKYLGWNAKKIYCGHVNLFRLGEAEYTIKEIGFNLNKRIFSTHFIYQFFDAIYFSIISLKKKNFPYQVEGYLAVKKKGIFRTLIWLAKSVLAATTYFESRVFFWFPGLTGHLICYKKEI